MGLKSQLVKGFQLVVMMFHCCIMSILSYNHLKMSWKIVLCNNVSAVFNNMWSMPRLFNRDLNMAPWLAIYMI
jgi:hypothetical protein